MSLSVFPGLKTASLASTCTLYSHHHMPLYAMVVGFVTFACSVDFLASFFSIISACVLSFVYLKRCKDEAVQPESRKAVVPIENNCNFPRKGRRRSRRKNRSACHSSKFHSNANMPLRSEGQAKAATPEEFDKKMRCRKNRNHRSSETSSSQKCVVKIYAPLELYVKLQFEPLELYSRLYPYVLYAEQLFQYGFPVASFLQPGYVVVKGTRLSTDGLHENHTPSRSCCRCKQEFSVTDDGLYKSDTVCRFHSGKRLSNVGVSGLGPFACCGLYLENEGCTYNQHHVSANGVLHNVKYVRTREKRHPSSTFTVYALDCEMCYTVQGLEVTRISLVGPDGLTVYDSFVLPENPVIDYNTQYSGITANDLKDVKTTLTDVQAVLLKLLTAKTILIGHGLENDLKALRIVHETVIDSTVVFPHYSGLPFKRSLKSLATSILKQDIQQGSAGHNSVEDARTCIELMLWKLHHDLATQPVHCPIAVPQFQCQWVSRGPFPQLVPYATGFWVPPVGSTCDLY